eukprot:evm.model.NODE_2982_length_36456_cov_21.122120.9
MALPSSSLTDPGTATNGNATGDSLATPDKSKLTDYLNTVSLDVLLHGILASDLKMMSMSLKDWEGYNGFKYPVALTSECTNTMKCSRKC